MPVIYYGPNQATALRFPSNDDLAHFQAAAFKRFEEGKGFFFTGAADNNGDETVTSFWMHPSIPLQFGYDVRDEYGDYMLPIDLDQEKVDKWLRQMAAPLGVIGGFSPEGPFLPFATGPNDL